MKKMKKLVSIILTFVMVLAMAAPAFAASITVGNAAEGETYNAYKIFDVTKTNAAEEGTSTQGFAYSIKSDSVWKNAVEQYTYPRETSNKMFVLTPSKADSTTLVVTVDDAFDKDAAGDFAVYLADKLDKGEVIDTAGDNRTATGTKKTVNGVEKVVAEFTELEKGYYFVTTSLGSLCALDTTDSFVVEEKNTKPSIKKEIVNEAGNTILADADTDTDDIGDTTTASIGDDVYYKITVKEGVGTDCNIIVYDKMDSGLTLDTTSFKINGVDYVAGDPNYSIEFAPGVNEENKAYTFKITFDADYVASKDDNESFVITYKAELNKDAVIHEENASDDTNDNSAWLKYSAQTTPENIVRVKTYKFDLVKTDDTNLNLPKDDPNYKASAPVLDNAYFRLYTDATNGVEIKVVATETAGVYRLLDDTDVDVDGNEIAGVDIIAGSVTIKGLKPDTYYLEETAAPDGYNKLTVREPVPITDDNLDAVIIEETETTAEQYVSGGVRVQNSTGTKLPSTGGIGTTIFYLAGIILMAGAVFFVIRSKKRED